MQTFFSFMVEVARHFGGILFRHSTMKRVFLVFMMMASLSRAIQWENEATVSVVCDNTTMYLNVNFTNEFQGSVYQSRGFYNPKCSYTVPFNENVTEVVLPMPFASCDIQFAELGIGTMASTEVVIQMHNLLDSIYDKAVNVSCEISNFQVVNGTESEEYTLFDALGLDHSWIELKNGLVLFGEVGEPTESALFLVVNVRDDGSNEDMVVQNCIAHTDKTVTNTTNLVQLSDYYGCPDPSAVLPNFTVVRPEYGYVSMFAYAPIANFSLIASRGRMSVSCGITICVNACPAHCNGTGSPVRLPLSDYATKDIVRRNYGARMPDSLRELNVHNDRFRRTASRPKRSLSSLFSSSQSRIVNGSVSEENVTITSIGIAKGVVLEHFLLAKDLLLPARQPIDVNLTSMGSNVGEDEFREGTAFRFVSIMTVCMFIIIVVYYCCHPDGRKKTSKD